MPVINRIAALHDEMTAWRHTIHRHPETAFEEYRTSDFVAARLEEFGVECHRGLAKTGVVGTLKVGDSDKAIALRADMDALHIHEANEFKHRSEVPGKMHACGHDGHTTMLLGAAKYLAETRNFDGTVHFIFQPAEENEGGGGVMVEEGLFDRFPVSAVYGMHNFPGIPVGYVGVRAGPVMAAFNIFEITVRGRGCHAAMPHTGIDPVVAAAQIVTGLQSIVSRQTDPVDSAVVSVTQVHGGDTWNVIPSEIVLRGTTRAFRPKTQDAIEAAVRRVADGICAATGTESAIRYERRYPPTNNSEAEAGYCALAAADVVGGERLLRNLDPCMGSEDFAFMLQAKSGCYIWLGNGDGEGGCVLHNPNYDFNDEILPIGASYWARLVETQLPR